MKGYTVKEAAELLGLKERSIRSMINAGQFRFKSFKLGTRRLIDKDEVDQHMAEINPKVDDTKPPINDTKPEEVVNKTPQELRDQRAAIEKKLRAKGLIV